MSNNNSREDDNFERATQRVIRDTRDDAQTDEAHDQDLQAALAESEELFAKLKLEKEKEKEEEVKKLSAEEYAQRQRENDQQFRDAVAQTGNEAREKREEERELQQAMRKSKEDYAQAQQQSDQDLEDVKRFTGEQADREDQDVFEQQTSQAIGISWQEIERLNLEEEARWKQRARGYKDTTEPASGHDVDSSGDMPGVNLGHNNVVMGDSNNNTITNTPSSSAQRPGASQPHPHPTPSNRASEHPAGASEDPNEVEKMPAAEKAREAFNRRFGPR